MKHTANTESSASARNGSYRSGWNGPLAREGGLPARPVRQALGFSISGVEASSKLGGKLPPGTASPAVPPGRNVAAVVCSLASLLCFGAQLGSPTKCIAAGPPPKDPPAVVGAKANEADFNTVTLTPKAEERLKIQTVAVEKKSIPLTQLFGGEVMVALEPSKASGSDSAQSIHPLLPGMTPADRIRLAESQVDADGVIAATKVQVDSASIAMERAERMLRDKSGSQRAVDEARASLNLAETGLTKAAARRELLGPAVLPDSTPNRVWIRVPVYAGDLQRIDSTAPAQVGSLGAPKGSPGIEARAVNAPPSADPAAFSVDLFFELQSSFSIGRTGECDRGTEECG